MLGRWSNVYWRVPMALAAAASLAGCLAQPASQGPKPETVALLNYLQPHPCTQATAGVLDAMGVRPESITRAYYVNNLSNHFPLYTIGYVARVDVADGPVHHVDINHDQFCTSLRVTSR